MKSFSPEIQNFRMLIRINALNRSVPRPNCLRCTYVTVKLIFDLTLQINFIYLQEESKDQRSSLSIYKRLASLRQDPAFLNANIEFLEGIPRVSDILAYMRSYGSTRYAVVINFGDTLSFSMDKYRQTAVVRVTTRRLYDQLDNIIHLKNIMLQRGDGLVLLLV